MGASVPSKSKASSSGRCRQLVQRRRRLRRQQLGPARGRLRHPGSGARGPRCVAQPPAAGVGQHAAGPAVDVEFAHRAAQAGHALALLGRRHGGGAVQRVGGLFHVVRVDDQRLGQLARRAGEAAEHQHALFRSSRAATNSLHTRFMPSCRLVTTQMSAARNSSFTASGSWCSRQQVHRLAAGRAEALVDAVGGLLHALLEAAVLVQRAARRRGHLHEDEAADPLRVLLQQPLHRVQRSRMPLV
jgi:hypothetical protein